MMRFLVAAVVLVAFGGCSPKEKASPLSKIEIDMTPNQVKAILGEPFKKSKAACIYVYKIDGEFSSIYFDPFRYLVQTLHEGTDLSQKEPHKGLWDAKFGRDRLPERDWPKEDWPWDMTAPDQF